VVLVTGAVVVVLVKVKEVSCCMSDAVVSQPVARQPRDRRPEELDEVVAQLNNLGGLGLISGSRDDHQRMVEPAGRS